MLPSPLRSKLCTLAVLFNLSSISVASGQSCGCSSTILPIHVDMLHPKEPTDSIGGLKSNASSLRHLNETYDVFSVFCQPKTAQRTDVVQLLSKDVGTVATFPQLGVSSLTVNYTGPIAKVVGSEDQGFCTGTDRCDDVAVLTAT
ncbi:hypothetical protein B0H10DRAFT_1957934, partial [Mycena sp. CBHHK59/15]